MNSAMLAAYQDIDGMLGLAFMLACLLLALWAYYRRRGLAPPFGLALFLAALAVRLIGLANGESLWYDESFSARIIQAAPLTLIRATAGDVHPPLYYLLLQLTTAITGPGEFSLRLPSALLGALAPLLVWIIARRYLISSTARYAAIAAAFLPGLLRYADEARMYTLLACLLLTAFYAYQHKRYLLFTAAAGLALYTHNYALLYLGALALAAMADPERRRGIWRGAVMAGLAWAPWGLVVLGQVTKISTGSFWIVPLTGPRLLQPLMDLVTGYTAPPHATLLALGLVIALTIAGLRALFRLESLTRAAPLLLWLVFPPLAAAIVSIVFKPLYLGRAMIAGACLLPVLWGLVFTHRITKQQRQNLARVLAGALVLVVGWFVFPAGGQRLDVRGLLSPLNLRPGDSVYHTEIGSYILLGHYSPDGVADIIFPYASDLSQSLTQETKRLMRFNNLAYEQARQQTAGRLFVVMLDTPHSSAQQMTENNRLRRIYPLALMIQHELNGVETLYVYQDRGL